MDYKILDDFLPQQDFELLKQELVDGNDFPWFYYPSITTPDAEEENFQFVHNLFVTNSGINSQHFFLVEPFLKKLNPDILLRVKANLGTKTPLHIEGGWHSDFGNFQCRTGVFYLNTNNGYTLFEDGTKVESVENRFVHFDSRLRHTGVSQTDTKVRVLINFNFIEKGTM